MQNATIKKQNISITMKIVRLFKWLVAFPFKSGYFRCDTNIIRIKANYSFWKHPIKWIKERKKRKVMQKLFNHYYKKELKIFYLPNPNGEDYFYKLFKKCK
jgi:glutathionyl-hydroquinone reductase